MTEALVRVPAVPEARPAAGPRRCCCCHVEAADAARAVRALRLWPQLVGDHGLAEVDLAPLEALMMSVGRLAVDVPHVAGLALEPVVLNAHGLFCVDVKVRIAEPPELDTGMPRRLRS